MSRTLEQLLYGAFYVIFILFILWGSYNLAFSPAPTCNDGIQNQDETGVDCGGSCQSCDLANLKPLKIESGIKKFSFNSKHTAFISVSNLNSNYSGDYDYKVSFLDGLGNIVDESYGVSYALPSGKDYIVKTSSGNFEQVKFEILGTEWNKTKDGSNVRPYIKDVTTNLTESGVEVIGTVAGDTSTVFESVSVIGIFRDSSGFDELFLSQSVLDNFGPFGERSFSMNISLDEALKNKIDVENTRYYISVNK